MTRQAATQTGLDTIATMFARAKSTGRAAFLPYFPVGFPTYADSLDAIEAMAGAGVDAFEIGIPFSDPLADGPTIQAATQIALENGITVRKCIEAVHDLRARGVEQPMLLMGYLNPLLAYRLEAFVADAHAAGAQGLIVPDLPPDEMPELADLCAKHGLAQVCFLAPTSSEDRIKQAAARATGFLYLVSITGVTGARQTLPPDLTGFIERVRAHTITPLVLGFGISQPEQARSMNGLVDGFIVGSALVKAGESGVDAVADLAATLRDALDGV
ncbi:MAG: tryptophan synthase subunit alpha [Anaerolineae bacterium]|jgi:tryptophan synthase alpha chain|nr:tryptophan synthase subunit alpha [Anaerolineae bacterium]